MNAKERKKLFHRTYSIRKNIIQSLVNAGSGHLGSSLGMADVLSYLYFSFMRHEPRNPELPFRDRLVLSIGHIAPLFYATLAEAGYFPVSELSTLRKLGSRLQGHPGKDHGLPGIEISTGSLGQGLSVAVGMALADNYDKNNRKVFCILGDGELQEGSIWEAAMSAGHYELKDLIAIVDRNKVQIDGKTEEVMSLEPLNEKWESFGWNTINCNGNDLSEIDTAFQSTQDSDKPSLIIANTKMSCGIKSIEDDYSWHGKAPDRFQAKKFLFELQNYYGISE